MPAASGLFVLGQSIVSALLQPTMMVPPALATLPDLHYTSVNI